VFQLCRSLKFPLRFSLLAHSSVSKTEIIMCFLKRTVAGYGTIQQFRGLRVLLLFELIQTTEEPFPQC